MGLKGIVYVVDLTWPTLFYPKQEHKFVEFPPKEIVDLLLSFVYIERYPLNFVRKIFNPFFMERLHSQATIHSNVFYCSSLTFLSVLKGRPMFVKQGLKHARGPISVFVAFLSKI